MNRANRSIVAAILAVAGLSATQAQAGLIYSVSRTSVNGWDDLTFRLTGWTGVDATYSAGTNGISTLEGTWTVSGSGSPTISVPGATLSQWRNKTTINSSPTYSGNDYATPPASYVNFDSTAGTFSRSPDGTTPTSFAGTWFTTGDATSTATGTRLIPNGAINPNSGVDQGLIAEIFVTPGADVSFAGKFNSYAQVDVSLALTSVPEPSVMGLVGAGGLMALRRRRNAC